ncbi:hypothetical protein LJ739_15380 [Aestuariibacter halophilus]|uniref:MSHA biogenesis protein MshK n=1 Tax=Fluctibacter halophilus TaxID=226011 RepID=A0ABS8GAL8_9ALTE|nr:hypothetical protein [Aestuariibacter halophilus]MCC2617635.1 hypothetical protein [Aestuariibacter halophilus]
MILSLMAFYSQGAVDPTRPLNSKGQSAEGPSAVKNIEVNAVFVGPLNRRAIINGDLVTEGQVWKGIEVKAIDAEGVTLLDNDQIRRIKMNQKTVLKEHGNEG